VLVTANHYLLDVVAGLVVLFAALGLTRVIERKLASRRAKRSIEADPFAADAHEALAIASSS
jgi:membrane-associated phospholipid phosphatase